MTLPHWADEIGVFSAAILAALAAALRAAAAFCAAIWEAVSLTGVGEGAAAEGEPTAAEGEPAAAEGKPAVLLVPRPATFAPFFGGRCGCGRTPDPP